MPATPPPSLTQKGPIATFQSRRVRQILLIVLVTLLFSLIKGLFYGNWLTNVVLTIATAIMALAYWLAYRDYTQLAAAIMLGSVCLMLSLLAAINEGARDEALLAYPVILIFAGMVGNRRLYFSLFALMVLTVIGMAVVNLNGIYINRLAPPGLNAYIDLLVVLSVTAFSISILVADLRRAMTELGAENERVLQSQQQIEFLANHDALTGLPNRTLARDRFSLICANAQRHQQLAALLFLDLDNFKTINDSLGHDAGDELLCEVAKRLLHSTRAVDTVCRQGGDEFLILVSEASDSDAVAALVSKIMTRLLQPYRITGMEITVTCSLGIALYSEDGTDFDTLLKNADTAMYSAKAAGRNGFRFFDAEMNAMVNDHLQLIVGMRQALQRNEFQLHYQPKFDLQSGRLYGAEALLRWLHPERGLIPPNTFIPIAEASGIIVEIGAWVLQEACRQTAQWRQAGYENWVISVNLSPVQFRRDNIAATVQSALWNSALPAAALELELTESLLINDSANVSASLGQLRDLGVGLAIDDFGTGYSNLGYLKRFDVQCLKIDQSFVRKLCENSQDYAIVRAIIQMAQSLKIDTVAEGIEDAATLAQLTALGCTGGQGYHWSPALPAEQFLAFAERSKG
ncbi:EAL domain-containing protein [Permianibacter sp. IMCC34836]|uniref:putative bifunctional diguanylate cyclase/phosphodiesterase n=1 Tax=Permianibacter fluminis TaxID=2738515 RepID=UPI0015520977|nr:EAL domain-containing protein [Permianibacter fluminis]NQD36790.1 EAL domain-containing protein [Permianibacter fluminis]